MANTAIEALMTPLPEEIRKSVLGNIIQDDQKRDEVVDKFLESFKESGEGTESLGKSTVIHLHRLKDIKPEKPFRHKTKTLTYRQRKQLGLYSLGRNSIKYKDLLPLHNLWKDYIRDCLNLEDIRKGKGSNTDDTLQQMSLKLYRADYHGCILKIDRSLCPGYVGKSGIVAMETKNCFRIVGQDNIVRTIPKATSMFSFEVDEYSFSFFGKNLVAKPADRSSKKLKTIYPSDL